MAQLHLNIPDEHDHAIRRIAADTQTSRNRVANAILAKSLGPVTEALAKEEKSGVRDSIMKAARTGGVILR